MQNISYFMINPWRLVSTYSPIYLCYKKVWFVDNAAKDAAANKIELQFYLKYCLKEVISAARLR